jgi:hypothetical protein
MLSTALVLEIRRLLDEGQLSQRAIAARLGVSRGSVHNVASGRYGRSGRAAAEALDPIEPPPERLVRCRGCGGRVFTPCRLCQARAYRERVARIGRLIRQSVREPPPRRDVA